MINVSFLYIDKKLGDKRKTVTKDSLSKLRYYYRQY